MVVLVGGVALLTAAVFPGSCTLSVVVTSSQSGSVRRLLRNAGRPVWFVAEKTFGKKSGSLREGEWNYFNNFFDVLVSVSPS